MCLYYTVAHIEKVVFSKIKRTMAKYFNGRALPSNEHFLSNVLQSKKMATVAKLSKKWEVI